LSLPSEERKKIQEIFGRFDYFRDGFSIDNITANTACFCVQHNTGLYFDPFPRLAVLQLGQTDTAEVYI